MAGIIPVLFYFLTTFSSVPNGSWLLTSIHYAYVSSDMESAFLIIVVVSILRNELHGILICVSFDCTLFRVCFIYWYTSVNQFNFGDS